MVFILSKCSISVVPLYLDISMWEPFVVPMMIVGVSLGSVFPVCGESSVKLLFPSFRGTCIIYIVEHLRRCTVEMYFSPLVGQNSVVIEGCPDFRDCNVLSWGVWCMG